MIDAVNVGEASWWLLDLTAYVTRPEGKHSYTHNCCIHCQWECCFRGLVQQKLLFLDFQCCDGTGTQTKWFSPAGGATIIQNQRRQRARVRIICNDKYFNFGSPAKLHTHTKDY